MKKSILLLVILLGFMLVSCNELDIELEVSNQNVTLDLDGTHKIDAVLKNTEDEYVIKFKSDNAKIAEVSDEGLVTAKGVGTAKITVTVEGLNELKAVVNVTVELGDPTKQITYEGPDTVVAGQQIKITAIDKLDTGSGIMWIALNPSIAKVEQDGTITGVSAGTAEFEIHSMENGFNIKIQIEVTQADVESISIKSNIDSEQIKTTANLRLTAQVLPKYADEQVVWETDDDSVAVVDEEGNVTILSYGEVTFKAKSIQNDKIFDEITLEFYWDVMDLLDFVINPNPIIKLDAKGWGWENGYNPYDAQVLGSVTNFFFGEYPEFEQIIPEGKENRPGTIKTSTEFITVHDTATGSPAGNAKMHSNLVQNFSSSWHYSIGNDGVYKQLPNDEVAYHAGDGSRLYGLNDTGIKATSKIPPKQGIDSEGYYTLDGVRTKIVAPKNGSTILTTAHINDYGIFMEIGPNGNWWMNNSWYSSSYNKIANHGGNRNSIGIESSMNQGSDLFLTWHYLAKKSARLALEYNLGLDRIVTHHFFSGKDCPMTLRKNGLFDDFRKFVEAEYLMNKFFSDYTFTFVSNNPDLVDNTGRMLKVPATNTQVSFLITVQNSQTGFNQSKLYYSVLPSK